MAEVPIRCAAVFKQTVMSTDLSTTCLSSLVSLGDRLLIRMLVSSVFVCSNYFANLSYLVTFVFACSQRLASAGAQYVMSLNVAFELPQVWAAARTGTIVVRDINSGEQVEVIDTEAWMVWCMVVVGKRVWAGTEDGPILIFDGNTRYIEGRLLPHWYLSCDPFR